MNDVDFVVGKLYRANRRSGAITTDPWGSSDRTITYADHILIEPGEVVMLVEYMETGNKSGIWIWLHHEKVIWQVLKIEKYNECWQRLPERT